MAKKEKLTSDSNTLLHDLERPKFSHFLTSTVVTVKVAQSRTYYLHSDLLCAESKRFANSLSGNFKEAKDRTIEIEEEDPELFGYFVEYLYRDRSILSRAINHYSEYFTLARLYAMGERLVAEAFQATCLWRFTQSLEAQSPISEEVICDLLQLACTEITERVREDPLRSQIFWFGGRKVATLQQSGGFRQMLNDLPDLGRHLCLWVNKDKPPAAGKPNKQLFERFGLESEHNLVKVADLTLNADKEGA
ncbi:hypothetical protein M3J09_007512 [Ascochyta lentis]